MIWIVFRSQTEAMHCRGLLAHGGVLGRLGKPPRTPHHPSCSWAVGVGWDQQAAARRLCAEQGVQPCAWIEDGGSER